MTLTLMSIPLIFLGAFIKPFAQNDMRCIAANFISKEPFCFVQDSPMPEVIKYGVVLVGFALLYAGRRQIKRQRGQN